MGGKKVSIEIILIMNMISKTPTILMITQSNDLKFKNCFRNHNFQNHIKNKKYEYKFSSEYLYDRRWISWKHERTMREFFEIKNQIIYKTEKFGYYFAIYALLVNSITPSVYALSGLFGSLIYIKILFRDIEDIDATDSTPILNTSEIKDSLKRISCSIFEGYSFAFQLRLIVPAILAIGCWSCNKLIDDHMTQTNIINETSLLVGFFSYKVAIIQMSIELFNTE